MKAMTTRRPHLQRVLACATQNINYRQEYADADNVDQAIVSTIEIDYALNVIAPVSYAIEQTRTGIRLAAVVIRRPAIIVAAF